MLIAPFAKASEVRRSVCELIAPPRRRSPSWAAAEYLRTDRGRWDPVLTPMLVEPLDCLQTREYQGVVFVGPARTGKTMALILGGIVYTAACSPSDMLVVQMSQDAARDFSRTDLDRAIRHSPELASRMSHRARDDNTFDKFFRSGMMLKLGWPAVSQLSSKTLKLVMVTDYDRPTNRDDVDGEGPLWDLAIKRTETYMSRGKCLAESSPGEDYSDAKWRPKSPHEAPPARGILSIYNRGTRARWYWPCQECGYFFQCEPGLGNFPMPTFEELEEMVKTSDLMTLAAELGRVACPECGSLHELDQRPAMNAAGKWVHDGQRIDRLARIYGERPRSQIASYWLGAAGAAYQRWDSIVLKYLQALQAYVRTGAEDELRATTNTDQGAPYLPRAIAVRRSSEQLMARAQEEKWPQGKIPPGVRFLVSAVDVQSHRFVVQVFGFGVGLEVWLVDRFQITASKRPEGDRFAALDPAAYAEDWALLEAEVIRKPYRFEGSDLELTSVVTVCDSGGKAGVTEKAYEAWRKFRKKGLGRIFQLVKGDGRVNIPRAKKVWPDSTTGTARTATARGDVPVWILNTTVFKDAISGDLGREKPGPGFVHLPAWLPDEVFDELTAESRTDKGWKKQKNEANEAFDLHVYARAACVMIGAERINWDNPPKWAKPIEQRQVVPIEEQPEPQPRKVKKAPRSNWTSQW